MSDFNSAEFCEGVGRMIYDQLLRGEFKLGTDACLIPMVGLSDDPDEWHTVALPCHRSFLRATCHSFFGIFEAAEQAYNEDCENNSLDFARLAKTAIRVDTDRDTLWAVREFIYTGNCSVTVESFPKLFEVAEKIGIPALQRKCLDLKDLGVVREDNWLQLLRLATSLNNTGFISIVYSYLKTISPAFIDSEDFKELTFDEINAMLTSPNRPFTSLSDFNKAYLTWIVFCSDSDKGKYVQAFCELKYEDLPAPDQEEGMAEAPQVASGASIHSNDHPGVSGAQKSEPESPEMELEAPEMDQNEPGSIQNPFSRESPIKIEGFSLGDLPGSSSMALQPRKILGNGPSPAKRARTSSGSSSSSISSSQSASVSQGASLESVLGSETPLGIKMLLFLVKSQSPDDSFALYKMNFNAGHDRTGVISKLGDLPMNLIRFHLVIGPTRGNRAQKIYMIGGIEPESPGEEPLGQILSLTLDLRHPGPINSGDWIYEDGMKLKDKPGGFALVHQTSTNTIYVMGGQCAGKDGYYLTNSVGKLSIDDENPKWMIDDYKMQYSRERFGAAILNNVIYMAGGNGRRIADKKNANKVSKITNSVEMLDLDKYLYKKESKKRGRTLKPMAVKRVDFQLISYQDKIWALGGLTQNNQKSKKVEIFDPAIETWSPGPEMQYARSSFAAFEMDGDLYVVGGNEGEPKMERFDQNEGIWTDLDFEEFPKLADFSSFIFLNK